MRNNYYDRPEVSNSDLTWVQKLWMPENMLIDYEAAFKFGSLIDAMITENHRLDYFIYTLDNTIQYTKEDFECASEMKKMFFRDPFCALLAKRASMQKVSSNPSFPINHEGCDFSLPVRCRWDFFVEAFDMSADLKSTACTSQKQFEESIDYFSYDRQAAWYLDIERRTNFMFIGISKVNFKVFKVPVKRASDLYAQGKAKYSELAWKYWILFGNINN